MTEAAKDSAKIIATFNRFPPENFEGSVGVPLGWVAIHHGHVGDKAKRRRLYGEWVEISAGNQRICRMLRFSPTLKKGNDTDKAQIVIDWIGWIDLCGREPETNIPLDLTICRVPWYKRPWVYLRHPDPAIRLSGWLGWISIFLGMLSVFLTVMFAF